jgi:thioredoxin-like negative regulator of GroEL
VHDPVHRPTLCLVAALLLAGGAPILRAAAPLAPASQDADDPDRLFSRRDASSVAKAAAIWKGRLAAQPTDAEAAWKLSRALYWGAANATETREARRAVLQDGVAVARRAIAIAPSRPEGHFWMAANMGLLAEVFGRREGLRYHDDIKKALDAVIAADPAFLHGSAQRALGRWYATVPGMFGGNKTLGEQHLRRALDYKRDSAITMVLLAELLIETGRRDEARPLLEAAASAPDDPEWAPEDGRFRDRARTLLASSPRR